MENIDFKKLEEEVIEKEKQELITKIKEEIYAIREKKARYEDTLKLLKLSYDALKEDPVKYFHLIKREGMILTSDDWNNLTISTNW